MKQFILVIGLVAVALVQLSCQSSKDIDDDAQVRQILAQISMLMRRQHNISRPMMEPTPELMDKVLHDDDIRYTPQQASGLLENLRAEVSGKQKRVYPGNLWSLPIKYAFDGTHSDNEKNKIRAGIQLWIDGTCLDFQEYPTVAEIGSSSGLKFTKGSGCSSYLGKVFSTPQEITLGNGCISAGIAAHEVGHALGLWHEHMRPDRDDYININYNNMINGYEGAFAKVSPGEDIDYSTGYDLSSVMHYHSLGFSNNYNGKARVITPKDFRQITTIGQRKFLSFIDLKRINWHYSCISRKCSEISLAQSCENGGYQDPRNCAKCRCPPGFGGDFCQTTAASEGPVQCGGEIEVPPCSSVSLTSPSWPGKYALGSSCAWKISSTSGLVFAFEKKTYMKASFPDTCEDYVEIISDFSKPGKPGNKFCDSAKSSGRVAAVDDGQAVVVFSGKTTRRSGFKLYVYATCGIPTTQLTNECLIGPTGYGYQGTAATPDSGTCSPWSGQSNHAVTSFPDSSLLEAGSACRNPDSSADPWCYTDGSYTTVGYCTAIPECQTGAFTTVTTTMGTTTTACPNVNYGQCGGTAWSGSSCCPEGSICYTSSFFFHQCVPLVSDAVVKTGDPSQHCLQAKEGRNYRGTVAVTRSGIPCQRWDQNKPHKHQYHKNNLFPDDTVHDAANYCRNPEGEYGAGVWCLTTDPRVRWEICDVPLCHKKRDFERRFFQNHVFANDYFGDGY